MEFVTLVGWTMRRSPMRPSGSAPYREKRSNTKTSYRANVRP
jgi:hypothetical protein